MGRVEHALAGVCGLCPLMRVHGQFPFREMWEFGGDNSPAFRAQLKFDRLRYRLMPYIYSLAGGVTHDGGTLMRALVMDFGDDKKRGRSAINSCSARHCW